MDGSNKLVLQNTRLERRANLQALYLIGPIRKLQRKRRVVNATPGTIFTTLYFFVTYE